MFPFPQDPAAKKPSMPKGKPPMPKGKAPMKKAAAKKAPMTKKSGRGC